MPRLKFFSRSSRSPRSKSRPKTFTSAISTSTSSMLSIEKLKLTSSTSTNVFLDNNLHTADDQSESNAVTSKVENENENCIKKIAGSTLIEGGRVCESGRDGNTEIEHDNKNATESETAHDLTQTKNILTLANKLNLKPTLTKLQKINSNHNDEMPLEYCTAELSASSTSISTADTSVSSLSVFSTSDKEDNIKAKGCDASTNVKSSKSTDTCNSFQSSRRGSVTVKFDMEVPDADSIYNEKVGDGKRKSKSLNQRSRMNVEDIINRSDSRGSSKSSRSLCSDGEQENGPTSGNEDEELLAMLKNVIETKCSSPSSPNASLTDFEEKDFEQEEKDNCSLCCSKLEREQSANTDFEDTFVGQIVQAVKETDAEDSLRNIRKIQRRKTKNSKLVLTLAAASSLTSARKTGTRINPSAKINNVSRK